MSNATIADKRVPVTQLRAGDLVEQNGRWHRLRHIERDVNGRYRAWFGWSSHFAVMSAGRYSVRRPAVERATVPAQRQPVTVTAKVTPPVEVQPVDLDAIAPPTPVKAPRKRGLPSAAMVRVNYRLPILHRRSCQHVQFVNKRLLADVGRADRLAAQRGEIRACKGCKPLAPIN